MEQTTTDHDTGCIGRRQLLSAVGGSAVAAALAGCSTLLSDGETADQGGQSGDGISDEPIQAGLLTFTRGAPGVLGIQAQRGAELAVQRINDAGGIGGQREIELDVVNEGSNPLDSYNQFIEEGKEVTFGPISSGTHSQIAPEVEKNGIINVSTDGTVTTLYEETVPDPTYSFRFQNYDIMEVVTMAREAVQRVGADNISTVAGVNPGYSFGEDEMRVFTQAIQQLTDAEIVYEGFPELGASDMANHITSINNEAPDVTFSSLWGGDVTTFVRQASANNMFENTTVFGTTLYSAAGDVPADALVGTDIYSGSRNYYWGLPALGNWAARPGAVRRRDTAGGRNGPDCPLHERVRGCYRLGDGHRESYRPAGDLPQSRADRTGSGGPRLLHAGGLPQHRRGPPGRVELLCRADGVRRRPRRGQARRREHLPGDRNRAAAWRHRQRLAG
jgi:branched-chain amino acid transport system substrate-binding protein